jgi:hypothetical protein
MAGKAGIFIKYNIKRNIIKALVFLGKNLN